MNTRFTADQVATWCNGRVVSGSPNSELEGLAIDTRKVTSPQLFAAIVGPNHDAHAFVAQAADAGAGAIMINTDREDALVKVSDATVITVPDTTRGIGDLAAGHRAQFTGMVVALTGSSGKTTTKEMIASVLEADAPCLKTEGNLNNDFGVPLTLLSRRDEHVRAVIEMGMNHRGEISRLAEITNPDIGLVTNVGTAHIEFLGSRDEIAAEKGDLFAAISGDGTAVANWDDERVRAQSKRAAGAVISFGTTREAMVYADDVRFHASGAYHFTLTTENGRATASILGLGETTVINALAAAAVGVACDLDLDCIVRGLENYRGIAGRMSKLSLGQHIHLIDDTYNANPQSMGAAIASVAQLSADGRAIAVLGGMGELGNNAGQAHRDAGKQVFEAGISLLVTVGEAARGIAEGAIAAGMSESSVRSFDAHDAAAEAADQALNDGDWVLVKGSRAARMEKIVEALREAHSNEESN